MTWKYEKTASQNSNVGEAKSYASKLLQSFKIDRFLKCHFLVKGILIFSDGMEQLILKEDVKSLKKIFDRLLAISGHQYPNRTETNGRTNLSLSSTSKTKLVVVNLMIKWSRNLLENGSLNMGICVN